MTAQVVPFKTTFTPGFFWMNGPWSAECSRRMGALSCFHSFIYRISLTSNKIYLEENLFIRNRAGIHLLSQWSELQHQSCNRKSNILFWSNVRFLHECYSFQSCTELFIILQGNCLRLWASRALSIWNANVCGISPPIMNSLALKHLFLLLWEQAKSWTIEQINISWCSCVNLRPIFRTPILDFLKTFQGFCYGGKQPQHCNVAGVIQSWVWWCFVVQYFSITVQLLV